MSKLKFTTDIMLILFNKRDIMQSIDIKISAIQHEHHCLLKAHYELKIPLKNIKCKQTQVFNKKYVFLIYMRQYRIE